jgi:hypothetical protein
MSVGSKQWIFYHEDNMSLINLMDNAIWSCQRKGPHTYYHFDFPSNEILTSNFLKKWKWEKWYIWSKNGCWISFWILNGKRMLNSIFILDSFTGNENNGMYTDPVTIVNCPSAWQPITRLGLLSYWGLSAHSSIIYQLVIALKRSSSIYSLLAVKQSIVRTSLT